MRRLIFLLVLAGPQPAWAEEPLLLRIRPTAEPAEIGGMAAPSPEVAARQAWTAWQAREAVWERSRRRAEIAIASICTGCMRERPRPAADDVAGPAP